MSCGVDPGRTVVAVNLWFCLLWVCLVFAPADSGLVACDLVVLGLGL